MKNIINEEIGRMLYLTSHKRGIVISEQSYESPNWKGKTKGDVDFSNPYGRYAQNVEYNGQKYTLTSKTTAIRLTQITEKPKYFLPVLTLSKNEFPYPDNMIGPKFDKFPDAKKKYQEFIDKLILFLDKDNLDNIGEITITGEADSATPTLDIPKGYTSLDHNLVGDSTPYGGIKDKFQMNQYLAENRAKVIGNMIITEINNSIGLDISNKIKYKSINHYGESSKRGFEYKKISITPTYLKKSKENYSINNDNSITKSNVESFIDLTPYGGEKLPAVYINTGKSSIAAVPTKLIDEKGYIDKGILPAYGKSGLNGVIKCKGNIINDEIFINNISFGDFLPASELGYDVSAESTTEYISKGRPVSIGQNNGYDYIAMLQFTLSKL